MTQEEQADAMERLSASIMSAISDSGFGGDIDVALCGLGSVVGCVAKASGNPEAAMNAVTQIAQGIVSGDLLD